MTIYSNVSTSTMDIGSYYMYFIEGLILIVVNVILATAIFVHKSLRSQKEYIVFATNMIFDAIFGLAYCTAGIYKLFFIYYREECKLIKYDYPPPNFSVNIKMGWGLSGYQK